MFDLITLNSEIISVALEPTICAPRILPSFPTSIFINPSVAPTATAFPLAMKKDLATLKSKYPDEKVIKERKNDFDFQLPFTDNTVTFKLLNHDDEQAIDKEIAGLKKIDKRSSSESSTRLKYMITSVNGLTEKKDIREFVDNYMLAKDARALRKYYTSIAPDVEFKTTVVNEDGGEEDITIPITLKFFWPDF